MWIVSGILLVVMLWEWSHIRFMYRREVNMTCYAVAVLLNDEMRAVQAEKFRELIRSLDGDAMAVSSQATAGLSDLAQRLARDVHGSTILGAHSMIWQVKQG